MNTGATRPRIERRYKRVDVGDVAGLPLRLLERAAVNMAMNGRERVGETNRFRARHAGEGVFLVRQARVS